MGRRARAGAAAAFAAALAFAAAPLLTGGFAGFAADRFPVPQSDPPVQPAGYAFAIWGLIYLWLLLGTGYGLWRRAGDADWTPARPWLALSLGLGAFWLPLAARSVPAATALILVMLATALLALRRTGGRDRVWQTAPVALYAGWLTAAAAVSLGLMIAGYGLLPETPAALLAIAGGLALALAVQRRLSRAPEYGIAVIWALAGILVANASPPNWPVAGLAAAGIAALLALRPTDAA
ncbi:hypothetical protein [Roseivivax sp. CAU 1761]